MENELWKVVDGTNGAIEISTLGRVKSNLRDGRILKTQKDKKGYLRVRVTINRIKKTYKVHRLVASTFIENPSDLPQVNHINGDKTDNRVSNLEWVNNYDNAHHAIEHGLWDRVYEASYINNANSRTPVYSVDSETGEVREFESVSQAERFFNSRHISDVLNGKRSKAAGQYFYRR